MRGEEDRKENLWLGGWEAHMQSKPNDIPKPNESPEPEKKIRVLPEDFKEKLKKEGIDPEGIPIVDKITNDLDGKFVGVRGTIHSFCVRLCPPLLILNDEGEETEYSTDLMNNNVTFKNGRIFFESKGTLSGREITNRLNDIFTLFNIIGIPFDFVSESEIILMLKVGDSLVETNLTPQANVRGENIKPVQVNYDEFVNIIDFTKLIYKAIEESDLHAENDIWKFFGKGMYYAFHADEFSTFIFNWFFIESVINWLWKNHIDQVLETHVPNVNNISLATKIDHLYLINLMDKNSRNVIHDLQQKRNKIFHVDPNPERRGIGVKEVQNTIRIAFPMFFKSLSIEFDKSLGINDIRMKMNTSLKTFFDPNL